MDRLENGRRPPHALSLGDADGPRASKLMHAVEDVNGNGNFGHATPIVRECKVSPITRFSRLMAASTRARRVYPDRFCQAMRPCSVML